MELRISTEEFRKSLARLSRAVDSKPQVPILSGILLTAEDGNLTMEATNYSIGMKASIAADVIEIGKALIPGKYLADIPKAFAAAETHIKVNPLEKVAVIKAGKTKFSLPLIDGEFPSIKEMDGAAIEIPARDFCELVRKTAFACQKDDSRPIFTGCRIQAADDCVTSTATDTHRLAIDSVKANTNGQEINAIIPSAALFEAMRLANDTENAVKLSIVNNMAYFEIGGTVMTSRLIEGMFPDTNRLANIAGNIAVTVDRESLLTALEHVALIARTADYSVARFLFHDNVLDINARSEDAGEASESIPCEKEGDGIHIAFNVSYIIGAMRAMSGAKVAIKMSHELSPAKMTDMQDDGFIYIVTPVRMKH